MPKSIDTLVADIEALLVSGVAISDDQADQFGRNVATLIKDRLKPRTPRPNVLSLSMIGKPIKQLWFELKGHQREEPIDAPGYLKFLYGDLIEELLLFLCHLSGHSVLDRQKQVSVDGINGHIDCNIDGVTVDVKSSSSTGFKKFKYRGLLTDDSFGYVYQLSGYDQAQGGSGAAFLAMDKTTGDLCLMKLDPHEQPDVRSRIAYINHCLSSDSPPVVSCSVATADNGNQVLKSPCSYCPHKHKCNPGLRTFMYSTGPSHLTKVVKEPRVPEVVDG